MPTSELRYGHRACQFHAMASTCEVLIDTLDESISIAVCKIAEDEAIRIEQKYSRYRKDNIISRINSGEPVTVDNETARLLDYAEKLYQLSDGMFDITAGVLRKAWRFDSSGNFPTQPKIEKLLSHIGWKQVTWKNPNIQLPEGMEIDLGGIGKEYAVDRTAALIKSYMDSENISHSVLINFGGDICVTGSQGSNGKPWLIGVDTGIDNSYSNQSNTLIELTAGGIATSGDTRRFLTKNGRRYGHILDPRTGWPVENAPSLVTVAADTCTEAGMLSTFSLLHGPDAENFLKTQGVKYWIRW